jgi:hypothetical protein
LEETAHGWPADSFRITACSKEGLSDSRSAAARTMLSRSGAVMGSQAVFPGELPEVSKAESVVDVRELCQGVVKNPELLSLATLPFACCFRTDSFWRSREDCMDSGTGVKKGDCPKAVPKHRRIDTRQHSIE